MELEKLWELGAQIKGFGINPREMGSLRQLSVQMDISINTSKTLKQGRQSVNGLLSKLD
jgi:hypothetical protein